MMIPTFFLIWFCALYLLPLVILFWRTSIHKKMVELEGLELKPRIDSNSNVFSIGTNCDEFIGNIGIGKWTKKYNIIVRIFQLICDDANSGKRYNPESYLSILKHTYDRFFSILLLCSFFPSIISIILESGSFYEILRIQLLCCVLVFVINIVLKNRLMKFREVFFRTWYDKILNFDLIAIHEIRTTIKNDYSSLAAHNAMSNLLSKFIEMKLTLEENIENHTALLTERLDEFIKCKEADESVSNQNILNALQSGIETTMELNSGYGQITTNINTALSGISELVSIPKPTIDAINENASLLKEIRDKFSYHSEKSHFAELEHLQQITITLEKNIDSTFVLVESALKKTIQTLGDSYERFSAMCAKFNQIHSATIDVRQVEDALAILIQENKKLEDCYNEYTEKFKEGA